jgi:ubiquinone/menaquinone biosynthesis C-methylase UbiE
LELETVAKFTDPNYLKTDQYKDSSNLDARVAIHNRFSTNPQGWMHWVFSYFLKLPEDAKILEVGCGPAYIWKENAHRIPAGWRVTLSDLSSGMLDAAWRNLVVTGRAFQFKEIDVQSIPFENETFDAVIANHMLYHVPNRQQAIGEIARVLKPDGRFLATTVGEHHLEQLHQWLQHVQLDKSFRELSQSFTLENGLPQLQPFFSQVTMTRYEDNLRVTEVEPIMAYIRSSIRLVGVSESAILDIQKDLEHELQDKGSIFIRKDSGLFEAVK